MSSSSFDPVSTKEEDIQDIQLSFEDGIENEQIGENNQTSSLNPNTTRDVTGNNITSDLIIEDFTQSSKTPSPSSSPKPFSKNTNTNLSDTGTNLSKSTPSSIPANKLGETISSDFFDLGDDRQLPTNDPKSVPIITTWDIPNVEQLQSKYPKPPGYPPPKPPQPVSKTIPAMQPDLIFQGATFSVKELDDSVIANQKNPDLQRFEININESPLSPSFNVSGINVTGESNQIGNNDNEEPPVEPSIFSNDNNLTLGPPSSTPAPTSSDMMNQMQIGSQKNGALPQARPFALIPLVEKYLAGNYSSPEDVDMLDEFSKKIAVLMGVVGNALGAPFNRSKIQDPRANAFTIIPDLHMLQGGGNYYFREAGQWTHTASKHYCWIMALLYARQEQTKRNTSDGQPLSEQEFRNLVTNSYIELLYQWYKQGFNSGLTLEQQKLARKANKVASIGCDGNIKELLSWWGEIKKKGGTSQEAFLLTFDAVKEIKKKRIKEKFNQKYPNNKHAYEIPGGATAVFAKTLKEALELEKIKSDITSFDDNNFACNHLLAYLTFQAIHHKGRPEERIQALFNTQNFMDFFTLFEEVNKGKVLPLEIRKLCLSMPLSDDNQGLWTVWRRPLDEYQLAETKLGNGSDDVVRQKAYGAEIAHSLALVFNVITRTDNYEKAVSRIAQMGGQSGFSTMLASQLAGAIYGYPDIPERWLSPVNQHSLTAQDTNQSRYGSFITNKLHSVFPDTRLTSIKPCDVVERTLRVTMPEACDAIQRREQLKTTSRHELVNKLISDNLRDNGDGRNQARMKTGLWLLKDLDDNESNRLKALLVADHCGPDVYVITQKQLQLLKFKPTFINEILTGNPSYVLYEDILVQSKPMFQPEHRNIVLMARPDEGGPYIQSDETNIHLYFNNGIISYYTQDERKQDLDLREKFPNLDEYASLFTSKRCTDDALNDAVLEIIAKQKSRQSYALTADQLYNTPLDFWKLKFSGAELQSDLTGSVINDTTSIFAKVEALENQKGYDLQFLSVKNIRNIRMDGLTSGRPLLILDQATGEYHLWGYTKYKKTQYGQAEWGWTLKKIGGLEIPQAWLGTWNQDPDATVFVSPQDGAFQTLLQGHTFPPQEIALLDYLATIENDVSEEAEKFKRQAFNYLLQANQANAETLEKVVGKDCFQVVTKQEWYFTIRHQMRLGCTNGDNVYPYKKMLQVFKNRLNTFTPADLAQGKTVRGPLAKDEKNAIRIPYAWDPSVQQAQFNDGNTNFVNNDSSRSNRVPPPPDFLLTQFPDPFFDTRRLPEDPSLNELPPPKEEDEIQQRVADMEEEARSEITRYLRDCFPDDSEYTTKMRALNLPTPSQEHVYANYGYLNLDENFGRRNFNDFADFAPAPSLTPDASGNALDKDIALIPIYGKGGYGKISINRFQELLQKMIASRDVKVTVLSVQGREPDRQFELAIHNYKANFFHEYPSSYDKNTLEAYQQITIRENANPNNNRHSNSALLYGIPCVHSSRNQVTISSTRMVHYLSDDEKGNFYQQLHLDIPANAEEMEPNDPMPIPYAIHPLPPNPSENDGVNNEVFAAIGAVNSYLTKHAKSSALDYHSKQTSWKKILENIAFYQRDRISLDDLKKLIYSEANHYKNKLHTNKKNPIGTLFNHVARHDYYDALMALHDAVSSHDMQLKSPTNKTMVTAELQLYEQMLELRYAQYDRKNDYARISALFMPSKVQNNAKLENNVMLQGGLYGQCREALPDEVKQQFLEEGEARETEYKHVLLR